MKHVRSGFLLILILMSVSSVVFAQSDAQKSFDKLKTLAGSWDGTVTTNPENAEVQGKHIQILLRVTSMGECSPARGKDRGQAG